MFIPYGNGKEIHDLLVPINMSGNIGLDNDQGPDFFLQLFNNAQNDPLWSEDPDEATKIIPKGRCQHCKHWVGDKSADLVQVQHVLNGCKNFMSRYQWRHLAVLDYIGKCLEKDPDEDGKSWSAFRCYVDVPGRRTHDDGTVPDQLLQTTAKPDIFILDQRDHLTKPEVVIIDLTIPWDDRVDAARSEKLAKFSKLVAAIKSNDAFNVNYQSIEIGSYRQRLSDGSEAAIKLIYSYFSNPNAVTFETFRSHLTNLVNCCSYEVFSSRNETKWEVSIFPVPKSVPVAAENFPTITELVEEQLSASLEPTKEEAPERIETLPSLPPAEIEEKQFQLRELLVILLIFCLILAILSVMWENLGITLTVGGICFPVLRYLGKI